MGKFKQFLIEQKEQTKVFYHNDMDGYGSAYDDMKNITAVKNLKDPRITAIRV